MNQAQLTAKLKSDFRLALQRERLPYGKTGYRIVGPDFMSILFYTLDEVELYIKSNYLNLTPEARKAERVRWTSYGSMQKGRVIRSYVSEQE